MKNHGEVLQDLLNEWMKINSVNEWNIWANKIVETKFGTYGTISIFDIEQKANLKYPSSWVKSSFINEMKDALSFFKHS